MEAEQVDIDRNNLIFLLLIVVTLMMMCTFLFAFFVLDNFRNVPCDVNRGTGPAGPAGVPGSAGKDNFVTGPKGLTPSVASVYRGPRGETGEELTGDTGDISVLGTGYVGEVGFSGPTGPDSYDGLVTFGLLFEEPPNKDSVRLKFYAETELFVKARAPSFTTGSVNVRVVLIRMGVLVTLNVYPFLIFREIEKVGQTGVINLDIFTLSGLKEYEPPRGLNIPVIVSKFTVIANPASSGDVLKATQTNIDSPGMITVLPGASSTLSADWNTFGQYYGNVADPSKMLFKSDDSPFGLEGVISVSWLLDSDPP
jgi:hypothetical protein